jgi:tRNA modification GTPase
LKFVVLFAPSDTITALATPPGIGGIAVLRISGAKAWEIADALTPPNPPLQGGIKGGSARFSRIFLKDELIDETIVTYFKAPHSYTGEDVIEISCHGGRYAAGRVLQLILANGSRMARPGEFTERAFLNGKLDLAQAEAVAELIHARTDRAGRAAARQLAGGLSEKVRAMRSRLLDLLALIELELDFSEEDVQFQTLTEREQTLNQVIQEAQALCDTFQRGRLVREGLRIAIIGATNAGKSTLLNALAGEDRAITSPEHGTTRDVVEARIEIQGLELILQDTAGIRKSSGAIESESIARTRRTIELADIVLLVVDESDPHWPEAETLALLSDKDTVLVLNKVDLCQPVATQLAVSNVAEFRVSALKSTGIEKLLNALPPLVLGQDIGNEEIVVTETRHHDALTRALDCLCRAQDLFAPTEVGKRSDSPPTLVGGQKGGSSVLLASDLRDALNALGEITGETVGEEILDRIFSKFCIGK